MINGPLLIRYRTQIELRIQQANELSEQLSQFEKLYKLLRSLITEGYQLLESERPVGNDATRISEQTNTCQVIITWSEFTLAYSYL